MSPEFSQKIAFGGDSSVYKIGGSELAKKIYDGGPLNSPLQPEKVSLYAEVTSQAKDYFEENTVSFELDGMSYSVSVNPINKVYEEEGVGVIIAPFVEGEPLSKSDKLQDIRPKLFGMSRDIEMVLGVNGIDITPGNAKICEDKLVITDLCASVRGLQKVV